MTKQGPKQLCTTDATAKFGLTVLPHCLYDPDHRLSGWITGYLTMLYQNDLEPDHI
jgi:hypothetical protein